MRKVGRHLRRRVAVDTSGLHAMNSPAATEDPRGESVSGELVLRSFVEVQLATETIAPLRTPLHYSPTTPLLSQFTGLRWMLQRLCS